jgi:hypothetical protein
MRSVSVVSTESETRGESSTPESLTGTSAVARTRWLLATRGCPVCRSMREAEATFLRWLEIEGHTSGPMIAQLRVSLGFCPRHTRAILQRSTAAVVLSSVLPYVVASAHRFTLDPGDTTSLTRCPACKTVEAREQNTLETLFRGLVDADFVAEYRRHGGLCLPHFLTAARVAPDHLLGPLTETIQDRLSAGIDTAESEGLLWPRDRDALTRSRRRAALTEPSGSESTLERLRAGATHDGCSLCRGMGLAERAYLEGLVATAHDANPPTDEPPRLCAQHQADVRVVDASAARAIAESTLAAWRGELHQFSDTLAALPASGLGTRLTASLRAVREASHRRAARAWSETTRSRRRERREAISRLTQSQRCTACSALASIEQRQIQLLTAALDDPLFAAAYRVSHGLCVHHLLSLPHEHRSDELSRVAGTRLAMLGWELDEARTKRAWSHQHETPGPELSGWLRALGQLDGRTFLGGQPKATMHSGGDR